MKIAEIPVGSGERIFVIAEAGCNHNGDIELAKKLIDVAKESGADAIKFQTFRAKDLVTACAPKARYALAVTEARESQFQMQQKLELSAQTHHELAAYCQERKILFLSSVFDQESVDLLEALEVPCFKIPSGEITNHPLLEYAASKSKPILLSTGMSYIHEVREALGALRRGGVQDIVLLHCTSDYPAKPEEANLSAMTTMANAFNLPVGYSDHTLGIRVSIAAVALGACVLEKHFTLDKNLPGPDHQASLEPVELKDYIRAVRETQLVLGDGVKRPSSSEQDTRLTARKSIVAARPISSGDILTRDALVFKRPGTGIFPSEISKVLGRRAKRAVAYEELITWEVLE